MPDVSLPAFVSISDAAEILGVKPWEVVRLVEAKRVAVVEMVDTNSLLEYRKAEQR